MVSRATGRRVGTGREGEGAVAETGSSDSDPGIRHSPATSPRQKKQSAATAVPGWQCTRGERQRGSLFTEDGGCHFREPPLPPRRRGATQERHPMPARAYSQAPDDTACTCKYICSVRMTFAIQWVFTDHSADESSCKLAPRGLTWPIVLRSEAGQSSSSSREGRAPLPSPIRVRKGRGSPVIALFVLAAAPPALHLGIRFDRASSHPPFLRDPPCVAWWVQSAPLAVPGVRVVRFRGARQPPACPRNRRGACSFDRRVRFRRVELMPFHLRSRIPSRVVGFPPPRHGSHLPRPARVVLAAGG